MKNNSFPFQKKSKLKKKNKVIGIVGTRTRDSYQDCLKVKTAFLQVYRPGDTICSGLCSKGADYFAVVISRKFHTKTLWFPADWEKHGKGAGMIRNTDIAKHSDILIACVSEDRTGGTEDTIQKYTDMGKPDLIIV